MADNSLQGQIGGTLGTASLLHLGGERGLGGARARSRRWSGLDCLPLSLGTSLLQNPDYEAIAIGACDAQRRRTTIVFGIDISATVDQELNDLVILHRHGP